MVRLGIELETPISCRQDFCQVHNLGFVNYGVALRLQRELVQARLGGEVPDTLLLLEHPAVITIGKSGNEGSLLVDRETLYQRGISIFFSDRGGNITAHSPGQLIGYPIMDLAHKALDPHSYVHKLEQVVIQTLGHFSITARRLPGHRGVWIDEEKVCSIGAKFNRSVSSHGFALNVNNDLNYFSCICPCGIEGMRMTSVSKALGREVTVGEVLQPLIRQFSAVLQAKIQPGPRTVSTTVCCYE